MLPPDWISILPLTVIVIAPALLPGMPVSLFVILPPLAIVRLPVTVKTPSVLPSEASRLEKVWVELIVTSAAFADNRKADNKIEMIRRSTDVFIFFF